MMLTGHAVTMTRGAYVHQATLRMASGADDRAPGGAVTLELCGNDHADAPCPLPHHTAVERDGALVSVRVLFVSAPNGEDAIRRRISDALASGQTTTPTGEVATWELLSADPSELTPDEIEHGRRLASPTNNC